MKTKYLILLIIAAVICFSIFFYQFSMASVDTFIVINETETAENGTITGFLMDAYARGVENKTITYHQAGDDKSKHVNITTGKDGKFVIENVKNVPDSTSNNYYGDFSFNGDSKFKSCKFGQNITIKG